MSERIKDTSSSNRKSAAMHLTFRIPLAAASIFSSPSHPWKYTAREHLCDVKTQVWESELVNGCNRESVIRPVVDPPSKFASTNLTNTTCVPLLAFDGVVFLCVHVSAVGDRGQGSNVPGTGKSLQQLHSGWGREVSRLQEGSELCLCRD